MKKIYFFVGTTAELIKLAPVIKEFKKRKVDFKITSSNQNKLDFSEVEFLVGKHKVDYTFKMKAFRWPRNIYLRFIVWIVKSIGNYLIYFRHEFRSDKKRALFVVHGDTITAFVGAVVAKLCGVKLVHIESGLRSFNFLEPFPEEICRFIISHLADVHFCPNKWAMRNLKKHRGIKINTLNNTIGESVKTALKAGDRKWPNIGIKKGEKFFVLVLHRQEHTLFNKEQTRRLINNILTDTKGSFKCVFIMHRLTKNYLKSQGLFSAIKKDADVLLPERLPYLSFIELMDRAEFVATDGGTNQEEAYYLGKPCLVLRNRTERIEGIGENAVLSQNRESIVSEFIENYEKYRRWGVKIDVLPSEIITNHLVK